MTRASIFRASRGTDLDGRASDCSSRAAVGVGMDASTAPCPGTSPEGLSRVLGRMLNQIACVEPSAPPPTRRLTRHLPLRLYSRAPSHLGHVGCAPLLRCISSVTFAHTSRLIHTRTAPPYSHQIAHASHASGSTPAPWGLRTSGSVVERARSCRAHEKRHVARERYREKKVLEP